MNKLLYDIDRATELLPLLNSISNEITERQEQLERIEAQIQAIEGRPRQMGLSIHDLVAEVALNRRELHNAKRELDRLGCSILGMTPMTIRIPGHKGDTRRSFVYRPGETALR